MNKLNGKIVAVAHNSHMSLVDVAVGDTMFSATLLETPETAPYLQIGRKVTLLFKETEVSLAKNLTGELSLRNRFFVTVKGIQRGDIMSAIQLAYGDQLLTSVITTRGMNRLQLEIGERVEALVKANEVVLRESPDGI
ncbi:MAG: TOBE domain-containing protein [Methylophilus sp.]